MVDGLNWDLLNDGIGNPKSTKTLLYSHATPPAMISGIRADAETAVRARDQLQEKLTEWQESINDPALELDARFLELHEETRKRWVQPTAQ